MSAALAIQQRSHSGVSVARGIASYIWQRNRIGLVKCFAYWLVVAVLDNTVFRGIFATLTPLAAYILAATANVALIVPGMYLLSAFQICSVSEGAVVGYPSYLLRMPARSEALAVWPMVFGLPVVLAVWLITDVAIVRPLGIFVDPILASIAVIAALFCGQAILWSPLGGVARAFTYLTVMMLIAGLFGCAAGHQISRIVGESILLVLSPVAAGIAIISVKSSRTGHDLPINLLRPIIDFVDDRRRPAPRLDSVMSGQYWNDWKREGLPVLKSVPVLFCFTLPLLFIGSDLNDAHSAVIGGIHVTPWVDAVCLFLPTIVASLAFVLGNVELKHPQLYRLPITSTQIFTAKLRTAALSAISVCGLLAMFGSLTLLTPAVDGNQTGLFGVLLFHRLAALPVAPGGRLPVLQPVVLFPIVLFLVAFLRLRLDGQAVTLGRVPWLYAAHTYIPALLFFAGICKFVENPSFLQSVTAWIIPYTVVFACLKLVAGATVAVVNIRRRMLTPSSTAVAAVVWLASVGAFAALWHAAGLDEPASTAVLIAGSILAIPAVRIGLIPLAVEGARHK